MLVDREPLRDLHGRPEAILRAGSFGVGRADDDVAGEGVALEHEVERLVQPFLRHLPGNERAVREVGREEGLAHAADSACGQQRADALDDGLDGDAGAGRDLAERVTLEAFELVLGDGEDSGIDRVVEGERNCRCCGHDRVSAISWPSLPSFSRKTSL